VDRGRPYPLGATPTPDGTNFAVVSRHATGVELLLFDRPDDPRPARTIELDPRRHRTDDCWHIEVAGARAGMGYALRVDGPHAPARGLRFDKDKPLLDPYGKAVANLGRWDRERAKRAGADLGRSLRSVIIDPRRPYDWEDDAPPRTPYARSVIYELHVRGFTRHESSGLDPALRGTYAGLAEKIPYLVDLGVTAVELLPVFAFDPQDAPRGLTNYWGYAPVSFFAPHPAYAAAADAHAQLDELRDLVKALHRAGLEVILDVVYNHTAEGDERGPTCSLRGLANEAYYYLDPADRSKYLNFSGTGNAINAAHPVARRLILDSLRWWVQFFHVDGFRFDLASILARDVQGRPYESPPVLLDIETDPVLAGRKFIAEAWDAAGLYQVGRFVGDRWVEWNGKFRDDVRGFLRGDAGSVARLAPRLLASPDLFGHEEREAEQSVNLIACHDGRTLEDLVTYETKRNEANGEDNRDGHDDERPWNCGHEGPTDDPDVLARRARQVRNYLALELFALGTPMLAMGDELRRTQGGNNNAYCQDNATSWLDWTLLERNRDLHRFVRTLVHRRQRGLWPAHHGLPLMKLLERLEVRWHGVRLDQPDWADWSHSLAFTLHVADEASVHGCLNAWREPLLFDLPPRAWRRWVDTALESPHDVEDWETAPPVKGRTYLVQPHSVVFLVALP
jgi:isoamylase